VVGTRAIFPCWKYLNNLNITYKSFNIDIYQLNGVRFATQAKD
jgi:hypothetical protein